MDNKLSNSKTLFVRDLRHLMIIFTILITLLFLIFISSCSQMDNFKKITNVKDLSEKTGIEIVVIDEAEKITKTDATRFVRGIKLSSYIDDPIHSTIRQESPKSKTVELPGISFLVDVNLVETIVDTLNKKFNYRQCLAFISNDDTRSDKRQTVSIIQSADKYNTLRFQETSGGSFIFSTDSLTEKLQTFESKYPFHFIGVGDDWLLIKTSITPTDWIDFAKEVLKVCPAEEEISINEFAKSLQQANGKVSMWWD